MFTGKGDWLRGANRCDMPRKVAATVPVPFSDGATRGGPSQKGTGTVAGWRTGRDTALGDGASPLLRLPTYRCSTRRRFAIVREVHPQTGREPLLSHIRETVPVVAPLVSETWKD